MHHETDPDAGVQKVAELIKDIRTAMLVTITPEGKPHSRPMATQDAPFDGSIWFLSDVESQKIADIAAFPTVAVTYASSASESYLSLTGTARSSTIAVASGNSGTSSWMPGSTGPMIRASG